MHSPIVTPRLELIVLDADYLAAVAAGQPPPDRGFTDPAGFLVGAEDVARLRLGQIELDPAVTPWLLRALVTRDTRIAVGFINFHAAPDDAGMVEIGYEVLPAYQRRGYASEASTACLAWAAEHGARVAHACVRPDNVASLAIVRRAGFVPVGEQMHEVDGLQIVFEKRLAPVS